MKGIAFALPALFWAQAQMAAEPLIPAADPAALLREAEESSPAIRAAQARLQAARHAPAQAEAPPDPEVSLAYTNDGLSQFTLGDSEFSQLAVTWTQEIRAFGKRKQAGEVAERSSDVAEKEVERVRLEVLAQVKQAYSELLRLDRTADILQQIRGILDSLEETARRRYEVGEGIQEAVLKAQTEILLLEAESARIAQDRLAAQARLNGAIGRGAGTPVGAVTIPLTGGLPESLDALAQASMTGSPEIGVLQAEVSRRSANADLARLEEKPDFTWSASYQYRGDLDPMVMGLFGVRLPLHKDRKQAQAVAQAESELLASRQDLANLQIKTQSTIRELFARAQRSDRLLALYRQGIVPQAEITLESARASYSVGRVGFLDLLNDLKALLQARTDQVSLDAELAQSLAALEPLVGQELLKAPPGDAAAGGGHASSR